MGKYGNAEMTLYGVGRPVDGTAVFLTVQCEYGSSGVSN